jgi:Cu+-exporting ATPase
MDQVVSERVKDAAETSPLTIDLAIGGMTCAACVARVEKVLGRVPGVVSAEVNLATERARVRASAEVSEAALEAAVRRAGYTARPVSAGTPVAEPGGDDLWHVVARCSRRWRRRRSAWT